MGFPAGALQRSHPGLHEGGVTSIQQSVDVASAPLWGQRYTNFEDPGDLADDTQRVEPTALEVGDGLLAEPSQSSQVDLSESSATSDGAYDLTEPEIVHSDRMNVVASLALMPSCRRSEPVSGSHAPEWVDRGAHIRSAGRRDGSGSGSGIRGRGFGCG